MTSIYWQAIYSGAPFVIFGRDHLLALLLTALAWLAVFLTARRLGEVRTVMLRRALVVFCVVNWLGWDYWQWQQGLWQPAYSLPLQLCTLSVPLAALMLVRRSQVIFGILYFWGYAGATNALLTPDLQIYGFPHFRFWIFFTSHGSILLALAYAAGAWQWRPTLRSLAAAWLAANGLLLIAGIANAVTGGNYLFVARTPEFPSLIDYLGPWPWYILSLQVVALLVFALVYAPYAVADLRARRRGE
jgi:hypothetical integral membrane protein (TIGR02206 family)